MDTNALKALGLLPTEVDYEVKHPITGEVVGTLKLTCLETTKARQAAKAIMLRRSKIQTTEITEEEVDLRLKEDIETVCSCVVGWDLPALGEYSHEKAFELFSTPEAGWLKQEVEAFIVERDNFFRPSQTATSRFDPKASKSGLSKKRRHDPKSNDNGSQEVDAGEAVARKV